MAVPGHYYVILLAPIGEIGFVYSLLTILELGLQKPYTKTEVGAGLELSDHYWTRNVEDIG
jgi:hypothetical protein